MHSKLTVLICAAWTLALPLVAADTGWKVTPVAGMLNPTSLTVPPTQTNIRPYSVAVDRNDQVYFWDEQCYIRRITPTGLVNVAGNGQCGDSGDDGPATSASIAPRGQMAFDTAGTLYFIDIYANRIRRISPAGTISSFSAPYYYFREPPIAVDMAGNVWSRNAQGMVLKFSPAGEPTEIAEVDPVFDGGIAVEGSGTVFVASAGGLFQVNASGVVTKLWGQTFVSAIAANPSGGIAFAENEIYELAPNGVVSLKAGGRQGYDGENGQAGGAAFDQISGLAYDSKGVLYVADWKNARIRSVSTNGVVRTVAGGAWSDNAPATSAELRRPNQLARDISGAIYVLDRFQVRRIGTDGIIRNYAGNGLSAPHTEGVVATKSSLDEPAAITCDAAGNLYIFTASGIVRVSSSGILQQYSRLRSWSWSAGIVAGPDGVIYVAGIEGIYKVTEGDSWKQIASFRSSTGLAIDAQGNLYGADNYLHRIRPNGAVERLSDELVHPASLALDAAGNIYFTSLSVTGDVTKFDPTTGQFTKLVMEGGIIMDPGRGFEYTRPGGILVEPDGGLLIANSGRHRIERFTVANCRFSLSTYSVFLNPVTGIEPIDVFTDGWCEFNVEVFRPYWLLSDYIRVRGPVTITPFIPSVNRPTPPAEGTLVIAGHRVSVSVTSATSIISTQTVNAPASGMTGTVLNAGVAKWEARTNRSWVQVFPLSGGANTTVTYTVYPNFSSAARTAQVLSGGRLVVINQAGSTLTANQRFVQRLYFNFFGRLPSAAELAFQVQSLGSLGRTSLFDNFFRSLEFDNAGRFIGGLYVGILNRDAEFGGWLYQRNALATGATSYSSLLPSFLGSGEFQLQNGTLSDDAFVRLLYRQILLRTPGAAEVNFQVSALKTIDRAQMAANFLLSTEFRIGTGPRLTTSLLYALLLGRNPSPSEVEDSMTKLQTGTTAAALANELMQTAEFSMLTQ